MWSWSDLSKKPSGSPAPGGFALRRVWRRVRFDPRFDISRFNEPDPFLKSTSPLVRPCTGRCRPWSRLTPYWSRTSFGRSPLPAAPSRCPQSCLQPIDKPFAKYRDHGDHRRSQCSDRVRSIRPKTPKSQSSSSRSLYSSASVSMPAARHSFTRAKYVDLLHETPSSSSLSSI